MERKTQIQIKLILTYIHTFTFIIVYAALCYMYLTKDSFLWEFKVVLVLYLISLLVCAAIWIWNFYCYWVKPKQLNNSKIILKRYNNMERYLFYHSIKISLFHAVSFVLLVYLMANYKNVNEIVTFGEYMKYGYLFLFYFIFAICVNYWTVYNIHLIYKLNMHKSN